MERLRVVETRLQQIEAHGQIQEPDVVLKSVPAQHFLALREVLPDMGAVNVAFKKSIRLFLRRWDKTVSAISLS